MSDRLETIQSELQSILDEKIGALHATVRAIHTISRELTIVESEFARQTLLHEELVLELADGNANLDEIIGKNESLEDSIEAASDD